MARDVNQIIEDTNSPFKRLWYALIGKPLTINTVPEKDYPRSQDRTDELHHAWVNIFTEFFKSLGIGRERSQAAGRTLGVAIPIVALVWLAQIVLAHLSMGVSG